MGTTTGTRTWQNKTSKGQTCVFKSNYIYSLAVLYKKNNNVKSSKFTGFVNGNPNGSYLSYHLELTYVMLKLSCGAIGDGKHTQPFAKFSIKM